MAKEFLTNLIICIISLILGIIALIGVIFCGAWWHLVTASGCFLIAWMMFIDNSYDVESVKHYIQRKIKRNKSNYGNME